MGGVKLAADVEHQAKCVLWYVKFEKVTLLQHELCCLGGAQNVPM
jgi:hypothetical protein